VFPKTSRLAPGSSSIIPHFSSPLFPLWIGRSFFSFQHANKHHCTSSISHEFLYTETPFFPRDAGLTFFLTTLIHLSFFFFFSTSTLCLLCCFWSGSVWLLYIFGSSELSFTFLLFARSYTSCMLFLLYLIFIKKELSQMVFYSLPLINAPSTTTKTEKNASLSCVMMNYSIRFRVLLIPAPCFLFFFYSHSVLPSSLLLLSPLSFIPPPYYTSLFF